MHYHDGGYESDSDNGITIQVMRQYEWFWGRLFQMAYKGCSHISTNLGPHKAQTQWV